MTENISAMDRARNNLLSDTETATTLPFPIVISYRSNFLPEGSEKVCETREQFDRQVAALVFSSAGSDTDRDALYEYFDKAFDALTGEVPNGCHYDYMKLFGPAGNLRFDTEYETFIRVPGMQD